MAVNYNATLKSNRMRSSMSGPGRGQDVLGLERFGDGGATGHWDIRVVGWDGRAGDAAAGSDPVYGIGCDGDAGLHAGPDDNGERERHRGAGRVQNQWRHNGCQRADGGGRDWRHSDQQHDHYVRRHGDDHRRHDHAWLTGRVGCTVDMGGDSGSEMVNDFWRC